MCDVMAEGLARQLRMVGIDAASVKVQGKALRYLVYRCTLIVIVMGHSERFLDLERP